jgi:hypothetical protein
MILARIIREIPPLSIGGGSNGSSRGSPGPDSDIYGNLVSNCWDDGLEVEGGSRIVKHTVSRNNILHVRSPQNHSISNNKQNIDNDYDYDFFNGKMPRGQETHGVRGEPIYAENAGLDPVTKIGRFQLAPGSPGVNAGQAIPNFSDGCSGRAPDIGAHQRGAPPTRYGVDAISLQS